MLQDIPLVAPDLSGVLPAPAGSPVARGSAARHTRGSEARHAVDALPAGGSLRAARRTLRRQIARLERELAEAFLTAYEMRAPAPLGGAHAEPRLLGRAELERVRDSLVQRLADARQEIGRTAEEQAAKRVLLERMLLEPGHYRFVRITRHELGEPDCGAWEVRPRLGLIGMLMGWWQVKLSSGCPLAGGRGAFARAARKLGHAAREPQARRWRYGGTLIA